MLAWRQVQEALCAITTPLTWLLRPGVDGQIVVPHRCIEGSAAEVVQLMRSCKFLNLSLRQCMCLRYWRPLTWGRRGCRLQCKSSSVENMLLG